MSLNIHVIKDKILSENWFVLRNMTYELTRADGSVVRHKREVYDRGNGATVLLYNRHKQTVVLVLSSVSPPGSMAIMTAC
ncbi:nudix hydrolase family protein YffH [Klebsiella pneumoniae]|nr:nudix hydrolase family protein YffH [Klebsiella pneumoniae]